MFLNNSDKCVNRNHGHYHFINSAAKYSFFPFKLQIGNQEKSQNIIEFVIIRQFLLLSKGFLLNVFRFST